MLCALLAPTLGYPQYRARVPNGYVNGQATGHAGATPFRWAFRDAGYAWTRALCEADTDGDGQSNGLELGDPCCVWSVGDEPAFSTDISIAGDPNDRTSRTMPDCSPAEPPPSPAASPPPSPASPPPPSPRHPPPPPSSPSCAIVVIGCGLSGVTAAAAAAETSAGVCMVCPSIAESTSAYSGAGWLLLPTATDASLLLSELEKHAAEADLVFERERAAHAIEQAASAKAFVERVTPYRLEPVPAAADPDVPRCGDVQNCCVDGTRAIAAYGDFTCAGARRWFEDSNCTCSSDGHLEQKTTWPPYVHLKNALEGKVMWFSSDAAANVPTLDVMIALRTAFEASSGTTYTSTVDAVDATETGEWELALADGRTIRAATVIFANGGFGAKATPEELSELAVASTRYVHAQSNTRLLRDVALARKWPTDAIDAWFVEFADGQPKWFLWEPRSTVSTLDGALLYDESLSYDERGRIRRRANVSEAVLYYDAGASNLPLTADVTRAIDADRVPKSCDSRSKRLWRNFLADAYGVGEPVDGHECSQRVRDVATATALHQGIIDTFSGPKVDARHRVIGATGAYAVGNAATPSLIRGYLAPGSTLGNALVSGFIAGRDAAARLQ